MTDTAAPAAAPASPQPSEQQPPQTTQPQSKPEQKEIRMLKAKVNGREELVSEEALLRNYQKLQSAEQKMAEATKKQKEIDAFYEALEHDPETALARSKLPAEKKRQLAEKWLTEQLEESLRDPREREMMELQAQLEEYRSKEEKVKQSEAEKQKVETIQKRQAHFQDLFGKAMEQSPLAKNPETAAEALRAMALHYRMAKQQGYEPDPQELAQAVEERYLKGLHAAASSLDGESLVNFLGSDVVKKIRQYDLGRLQVQKAPPQVQQDWQPNKQSASQSSKVNSSDILREARKQR
jgi:hypothetical protein